MKQNQMNDQFLNVLKSFDINKLVQEVFRFFSPQAKDIFRFLFSSFHHWSIDVKILEIFETQSWPILIPNSCAMCAEEANRRRFILVGASDVNRINFSFRPADGFGLVTNGPTTNGKNRLKAINAPKIFRSRIFNILRQAHCFKLCKQTMSIKCSRLSAGACSSDETQSQ